jgi:hypothetical protein
MQTLDSKDITLANLRDVARGWKVARALRFFRESNRYPVV